MKKILTHFSVKVIAFMLLCAVGGVASAQEKSVVIVGRDGTVTAVAMTDVDRIDIGAMAMTVRNVSGKVTEYAYTDVDRVLIGQSSTAVDKIRDDGSVAVWPVPFTDVLNISGLAEGTEVRIYDIRGNCVASEQSADVSVTTIGTSALASGVYVLKYGDKSLKIIRQ